LPATVTDGTASTSTVTSAERSVPTNGDLTEVVFALGLGSNVVARGLSATYPPEVAALPVVGYQRMIAAEPVAAFSRTLVVASSAAGRPAR
jgi:iron complex transport system substrate-binding protein